MKDGKITRSTDQSDSSRDVGAPRVKFMRASIATTLRRNLIRLLLTFLAVAFVTCLLVWHTQRPDRVLYADCVLKDADGNWQLAPCPD